MGAGAEFGFADQPVEVLGVGRHFDHSVLGDKFSNHRAITQTAELA